MRTLSADLLALQDDRIRYPVSQIIFTDTLLRFAHLSAIQMGSGVSTEVSGIPIALVDADFYGTNSLRIAWLETYTGLLHTSWRDFTDLTDFSSGSAITIEPNGMVERVSVHGQHTYYHYSDDLFVDSGVMRNNCLTAGLQTSLAAVADNNVYSVQLHTINSIQCALLMYHTDSSSVSMDYYIQLGEDYNAAALTWFDAVRLDDGSDLIVVNTNNQGSPKLVKRTNGVWSDTYDMLPVDIVDNYSYLRIGWLKLYDGVIYATGELGRKGSSGKHPQSMGVILRSTDGIHWTLDRYRYLGQTPLRSPLLIKDGYCYRINTDATMSRAARTPLFGLTSSNKNADSVWIDATVDILGWQRNEVGGMESGTLNIALSNMNLKYTNDALSTYLKPGYQATLFAGYKDTSTASEYTVQLGVYLVDQVPKQTAGDTNAITVSCREWAFAHLKDNQLDQDYQWLSATRHFDDCDKADGFYALTGGYISVANPDNSETAQINATTLTDRAGLIQFITKNKNSIAASTTPFEATDGEISVLFKPSAVGSFDNGGSFSSNVWGCGAGVSFIQDANNGVIAFYNAVDKALKLMTLRSGALAIIESVACTDFTKLSTSTFRITLSKNGTLYQAYVYLVVSGSSGIAASHNSAATQIGMLTDSFGVIASHGVQVLSPSPAMPQLATGSTQYYVPASAYSFESYYDGNGVENMSGYPEDHLVPIWNMPSLVSLRNKPVTINGSVVCSTGNSSLPSYNTYTNGRSTGFLFTAADVFTSGPGFVEFNRSSSCAIWLFSRYGEMGMAALHLIEAGTYRPITSFTYTYDSITGNDLVYRLNYTGTAISWVSDIKLCLMPVLVLSSSSPASITSMSINSDGGIDILDFTAFDRVMDKSLVWNLHDIATKAGITRFGGITSNAAEYEINESWTGNDTHWLSAEMANAELDLTLPSGIASADTITIYLGCSSKSSTPTDGYKIVITGSTEIQIQLYHTANSTWTICFGNYSTGLGAKNLHISKRGRYVVISAEGRQIAAHAFHSNFDLTTDNYSAYPETGGYCGIASSIAGTKTVKQAEIYQLVGCDDSAGIIVDQKTPCAGGLQKVIRDMRIKVLPDSYGGLRISNFDTRPDLGTAPDVIYSDQSSPSNRIPTHIRVVGEEIGEYFDHTAMAEYGVLFSTINVETLNEDEAYQEAERTVNDAMSYTEGSQNSLAAQLQWEIEDEVTVGFTATDGTVVSRRCIVDGIATTFGPGMLESQASLRKVIE